MLSLERCNRLLGGDANSNRAQLERLRQDLYALAEVVADPAAGPNGRWLTSYPFSQTFRTSSNRLSEVPPCDRYELNERAAILEWDAGMNRSDAEHEAIRQLTNPRTRTNDIARCVGEDVDHIAAWMQQNKQFQESAKNKT